MTIKNDITRSVTSVYKILSILVFLFTAALICPTAHAQNGETRPVARLITSAHYSSPRRAKSGPDLSVPATALLPSVEDANATERRAFDKTNQVRMQNGLSPLVWDADLCRMARANSENMARLGYFSHVSPGGSRLRDRARAVGILRYSVLGENIAYNQGYDDPGSFAVERWMVSPGHRANILSLEFQASAIGAFVAADGSVYLTQVFLTR